MDLPEKRFPLLDEIDREIDGKDAEWSINAFKTLVTSNLSKTTVHFYAINVGLSRLEKSLYEHFWDLTADALTDFAPFLFDIPVTEQSKDYLHEAKCQFLMFAAIGILKFQKMRHRLSLDAKLTCATMILLLFEQNHTFHKFKSNKQYLSCLQSMRARYFRRFFLAGLWLETLTTEEFDEIQLKHENYLTILLDNLFPARSIREKIRQFIDKNLLENYPDSADDDAISSSFVFIQRFPKFDAKQVENRSKLISIGLSNTMNSFENDPLKLLNFCFWTLSCMMKTNRISLDVIKNNLKRDHFSDSSIDFEQKPTSSKSLNEEDLIVFLLLCVQQNQGDFALNVHSLFSPAQICTEAQKNWWIEALQANSIVDAHFLDRLAMIRLNEEFIEHFPPKEIILRTAKILLKSAEEDYERAERSSAAAHEQYASRYVQMAKQKFSKFQLTPVHNKKQSFFNFSLRKSADGTMESELADCFNISNHCEELKSLSQPEFPRASTPIDDGLLSFSPIPSPQPEIEVENISSPNESSLLKESENQDTVANDSTTTTEKYDESDGETSPEGDDELVVPIFSPLVDKIFTHINGVNQWINGIYASNVGIQADINAIRDRLEKLNRATNQMIGTNMKLFQMDSNQPAN